MRLCYPVTLKDFQASRPPFTARAGSSAGVKGVLVTCGVICVLGVVGVVQKFAVAPCVFAIVLTLLAAWAAYAWDKRCVDRAKHKHERKTLAAYQQQHCLEERIFETIEGGYQFSCKCGTVFRAWTELTQFSENNALFKLRTAMGLHLLPKSAFASESQRNEFRAMVADRRKQDAPSTAKELDMALAE
jgi:hypothetical protein